MNKTELIAAVAEKTGLSKKDTEAAVNATLLTITETLKAEEKVQLVKDAFQTVLPEKSSFEL